MTINLNSTSLGLVIPILILAAMCVGCFWHMIIISLRNNQRERELQSQERIKAIEYGYPLDQPKLMTAAIAIGVTVPCAAVAGAFIATAMNAGLYAWPPAGALGIAAVVCATILAIKAANQSQKEDPRRKPATPPELAEMASHHG